MLPAGSYPLQALLLVVQHFELLQLVLKFFAVEAVVPVYWIFSSLVLKHQQSIFSRTLRIRGVDPAKVGKWGPQQRAQIEGLVGVHQDRIRARQQQKQELSHDYPAAAKAVWLFTPPKPNAGRGEYILKRLVTAPFRAVLPFLPALFGAANAHTSAMDAMQPYFIMKGPISEAEMEAIVDRHRWQFRHFTPVKPSSPVQLPAAGSQD
ncbi:hypothetical protein WJX84_010379 [Apatococcus fuscideae]|uniref:ATP synthase protein 8 n=1 Tax=Apatococcus fuscideae TaxID=2026836 RepID=A0AAW1REL0_9CHLO